MCYEEAWREDGWDSCAPWEQNPYPGSDAEIPRQHALGRLLNVQEMHAFGAFAARNTPGEEFVLAADATRYLCVRWILSGSNAVHALQRRSRTPFTWLLARGAWRVAVAEHANVDPDIESQFIACRDADTCAHSQSRRAAKRSPTLARKRSSLLAFTHRSPNDVSALVVRSGFDRGDGEDWHR